MCPPQEAYFEPEIDINCEPPGYVESLTPRRRAALPRHILPPSPIAASSSNPPPRKDSYEAPSFFSSLVTKVKNLFTTGSFNPHPYDDFVAPQKSLIPNDPARETGLITTYGVAGFGVGVLLNRILTKYTPLAVAGVIAYQLLRWTGKVGEVNIDLVGISKRCVGTITTVFNITEDDLDNYAEYLHSLIQHQQDTITSSMSITVSFASGVIVGLIFF